MDANDTKPTVIPTPEAKGNGTAENPSYPKAGKGQVDILVTLLALAVTEGVKLGAELLIRKFTRR